MTSVNRKTAVILTALFLLSAPPIAGLRLAEAASPERREVHRQVKDFPEKEDLSTPESAFAAWSRKVAAQDPAAISGLSWVQFDAKLTDVLKKALKDTSNTPSDSTLATEIVEVLIYQGDLAALVLKSGTSDKPLFRWHPFGQINGQWKELWFYWAWSEQCQPWPSVEAAVDNFEAKKEELWQQFINIRNKVLNGHAPTMRHREDAASETTFQWPRKASTEGNWEISLALNMPQQRLQAVQYVILDYDPIPIFQANVKRMQTVWLKTLSQQESELQKEAHRASQATVNWDSIFESVNGDKMHLLTRRDGASLSSGGVDGTRWLVTKVVDIDEKPVCWCLPIAVKTGERIRIVLNSENTYDLCGSFNKILQPETEPAASLDAAQLQKLVEEAIAKQHPEIKSRETVEWDKPSKADNGQMSIRYKYLAKFSGGETKIMNEIFSFDAQGKFVSLADVAGFPRAW